jgi:acyl carrier protein
VFGIRPEQIDLFASPADTEGWDSIAHMELVTLVEERWGIELTNTDVIGIASLDAVIACIERASE